MVGTNVKVCMKCGAVVRIEKHVGKFGMKKQTGFICNNCKPEANGGKEK